MQNENGRKKHTVLLRHNGQQHSFEVASDEFVIGRGDDALVRFETPEISRHHVKIMVRAEGTFIRDLGSSNGTFLDGKLLRKFEDVKLVPDQLFTLGRSIRVLLTIANRVDQTTAPSIERTGRTLAPTTEQRTTTAAVTAAAVTATPAVAKSDQLTAQLTKPVERDRTKAVEKDRTGLNSNLSLNNILNMERKRLYEGVDSLKAELSDLLAQKRETQRAIEKSKQDVEEQLLALRVERIDLEKELKEARARVEQEIEAMEGFRANVAKEHEAELTSMDARQAKLLQEREDEFFRIQKEREEDFSRQQNEHSARVAKFQADAAELAEKNQKIENDLHTAATELEENLGSILRRQREADDEHSAKMNALDAEKQQLETEVTQAREALDAVVQQSEDVSHHIMEARIDLDKERERAAENLERLNSEAEAAEKATEEQRASAESIRKEIENLKSSLQDLNEHLAKKKTDFESLQADHMRVADELKAIRLECERDKEVHDLEKRRHQAQLETTAMELQAKRAAIEAEIETCKLEQMKSKRDLQAIIDQLISEERNVHQTESKLAETKLQVEQLEEERRKKQADLDGMKAQEGESSILVSKLKNEEQAIHESISSLRKDLIQLRSEIEGERTNGRANLQTDIKNARDAVEVELKKARETTEAELRSARAATENELRNLREATMAELKSARDSTEAEISKLKDSELKILETQRKRRSQDLEEEFSKKGTAMELDLAKAKLNKLNELEKIGKEKAALDTYRRDFMVNEILRGALELAKDGPLIEREIDMRSFIQNVLDGKTTSTASAQAVKRTNKFWKKVGSYAAVPVAIAAFFYIFPEVPSMVSGRLSRKIASEQTEKGIFFDEIKEKGMKYQPEMDKNYRTTYSDNLLYLEGYSAMKMSDEEKKRWTVLLNDFIVGRLGLGDRIIPNFISAETILINDLMKVREGMLPQYKDQSLARMAEIEKEDGGKMISMLEGAANYQKFRALEKSYYEDYLNRRAAKSAASPANPVAAENK